MPETLLRFTCDSDQAHALSDYLADHPDALAVSLLDAEDQPIYEPELDSITLWAKVEVEVLLAEDTSVEALLAELRQQFGPLPPHQCHTLIERDWVTETQAQFPPQCFAERLWLYPVWLDVPTEHQPVLRLSPGLAFGTGTHPTTRLCLQWLATHIQGHETVIDYGCGSGILALAALVLGAKHVSGVDLDPQALSASRANAELNAIDAALLSLYLPEQIAFQAACCDVLIANILASPLIHLAPQLSRCLKNNAHLVLSGILVEQVPAMIDAYRPFISLTCVEVSEEWCLLVGKNVTTL